MMYYIKDDNGHRWKVCSAVSLKAACNEINHARATGSVGSASYMKPINAPEFEIANVVRVHSDLTEQKPYETLK